MQNILVEAVDVWEYFVQHKQELKDAFHVIAENDEYGVVITITEEDDFPLFVVTSDDYQYDEVCAVSKRECEEAVSDLYDVYLTDTFVDYEGVDSGCLISDEDLISERELELDDITAEILDVIFEKNARYEITKQNVDYDALCEDLKDHILEYLARKYKFESIRRPMVMEDGETGEEFFTEYPYKCILYEDFDNPIYEK